MCDVDHDTQTFEFGEQADSEVGETFAIEAGGRHRRSGRIRLEVHESEHAQTALPGLAQVVERAFDAVGAFEARQGGKPSGLERLVEVCSVPDVDDRVVVALGDRLQQVEGLQGLVDADASFDLAVDLERPKLFGAHLAWSDDDAENGAIQAGVAGARQVHVPCEGRARKEGLVPLSHVVSEESLPQQRVDVEIEHRALPVKRQDLGGKVGPGGPAARGDEPGGTGQQEVPSRKTKFSERLAPFSTHLHTYSRPVSQVSEAAGSVGYSRTDEGMEKQGMEEEWKAQR